MNKMFTKEALTGWIKGLIQAAKEDEQFSVSWFIPTKEESFCIVGGWLESGFDPTDRDIFCISESNPKYAMAIKVVINEGPYAYCDFETLNMPMDINNPDEVDDTCMILEWNENPEAIAEFIGGEWARITEEYREVC